MLKMLNIIQVHLLLCSPLMQHPFKYWFSVDYHRHLNPAPNGYACKSPFTCLLNSILQKKINRFFNSCPPTNFIMTRAVPFKTLVSTYQTTHHHIPQECNAHTDPVRPSVSTYSGILGTPASYLSLWLILNRLLLT